MIISLGENDLDTTIRIEAHSKEELAALRDVFTALDFGQDPVSLGKLDRVRMFALSDLMVELVQKKSLMHMGLEEVGETFDGPFYLWCITGEERTQCVDTLERFIGYDEPGCRDLFDGLFMGIELSYKE